MSQRRKAPRHRHPPSRRLFPAADARAHADRRRRGSGDRRRPCPVRSQRRHERGRDLGRARDRQLHPRHQPGGGGHQPGAAAVHAPAGARTHSQAAGDRAGLAVPLRHRAGRLRPGRRGGHRGGARHRQQGRGATPRPLHGRLRWQPQPCARTARHPDARLPGALAQHHHLLPGRLLAGAPRPQPGGHLRQQPEGPGLLPARKDRDGRLPGGLHGGRHQRSGRAQRRRRDHAGTRR